MRGKRSRMRGPRWGQAALLLALSAALREPAPGLAEDDEPHAAPVRAWQEEGPPETSLDFVFVGDGYQREHLSRTGKYWRDVNRYARRLLDEPPFSWYRKRTNVHAVFLESRDAGVGGETALGCRYLDERRVAFTDEAALEHAVRRAPAVDICLVMVNVERPGGYFRAEGVFRPFPACRMRAVADPFCPVCCEQISKVIGEATGVPWDPAAWAKEHPLRQWR